MLDKKELKQFVSLVKKIDKPHEGLPQPVFDSLLNIVPFVGCELVVKNKKGILLTWREDKWWKGWHIPGGLLRYDESFKKRINETAKKEIGVLAIESKFLFPINYMHCSRGHAVSLVYLCKTKKNPKIGKFFKRMPKGIIKEHKVLWKKIQENI